MVSAESTIVKEEFTYGEGKLVSFIAYDSAKKASFQASWPFMKPPDLENM